MPKRTKNVKKAKPINKEKLRRLIMLIERLASGDRSAIPEIRSFAVSTDDDGWCLYHLNNELKSAFSYDPGRTEAIKPLLNLAKKVSEYKSDKDIIKMIYEPEFDHLIQLRGPWEVEFLQVYHCPKCGKQRISMGLSGMSHMAPLECPNCGNVYFQFIGDTHIHPTCHCGAQFSFSNARTCDNCGTVMDKNAWKPVSLYEYFQDHKFFLAKGFRPLNQST
jgi:rubrerythrin